MPNDKLNWWEWLRFITPVLLTITLFMVGTITAQINSIDEKIFKHLTNEEIHVPRSYYVTKAEFDLITRVRETQFQKIETGLTELRALAMEQIRKCGDGK